MSSTSAPHSKYKVIRSSLNNGVLEITDRQKGAALLLSSEYKSSPAQHFYMDEKTGNIHSELRPEFVLDLDSSGKILLWKPNGQENQKWHYDVNSREIQCYNGKVMDIEQGKEKAFVIGAKRSNAQSQKFTLGSPERPFYIKNRLSNLVLEVPGNNVHENAEIVMFNQQGEIAQQWIYKNGYIEHVKSGKVMQMNDDKSVTINSKNGGTNQRWNWDGTYLINVGNGQMLEVPDDTGSQYVKPIVAPKNGEKRQQWNLKYA